MIIWEWICTKINGIMNKYIRESVGVTNMVDKMKKNRLRWSGHVDRINKNERIKKICETKVEQQREEVSQKCGCRVIEK